MALHSAEISDTYTEEALEDLGFRLDELRDLNQFATRCSQLHGKSLDPHAMELLRDFIHKICLKLEPRTRLNEALALDLLNNQGGLFDTYRSFAQIQQEVLDKEEHHYCEDSLIDEDEEFAENYSTSWLAWFEDILCRCEDEDADHHLWAAATTSDNFETIQANTQYIPNLPLATPLSDQSQKHKPYSDFFIFPTDDGTFHRRAAERKGTSYRSCSSTTQQVKEGGRKEQVSPPAAAVVGVVISV
eukprot:CAMPEP_0197285662 /NCGR_PEP_ID=MMETSP0890-20130614/1044_1 /TAXON_ID=44058 ORGANISM="Aureoumbra lagunensis, Strain CCMP1510" /NCGR_SAMPLE_ID=MMETSP0890 /ASSEMBLY_ACC=CAM_ASM_000533 /LENGTH=244 /DNA_ID=CAMNT_0042753423 /DNA_START=211 /DNA_END=945 /DNA_ORIENTATION=+